MLVSVSTRSGEGVASVYVMEASPGAPPVVPNITIPQGGSFLNLKPPLTSSNPLKEKPVSGKGAWVSLPLETVSS
jgi:hypothetical protein